MFWGKMIRTRWEERANKQNFIQLNRTQSEQSKFANAQILKTQVYSNTQFGDMNKTFTDKLPTLKQKHVKARQLNSQERPHIS